jgi:hypothetical protein
VPSRVKFRGRGTTRTSSVVFETASFCLVSSCLPFCLFRLMEEDDDVLSASSSSSVGCFCSFRPDLLTLSCWGGGIFTVPVLILYPNIRARVLLHPTTIVRQTVLTSAATSIIQVLIFRSKFCTRSERKELYLLQLLLLDCNRHTLLKLFESDCILEYCSCECRLRYRCCHGRPLKGDCSFLLDDREEISLEVWGNVHCAFILLEYFDSLFDSLDLLLFAQSESHVSVAH